MSWLDLHMHSNISNDGEFSPKKLMELCLENSIKVAALADHNSVRGIKDASLQADELGIQLIPAIELDCTFRDVDLHLLGYGINFPYFLLFFMIIMLVGSEKINIFIMKRNIIKKAYL